MAVAVEATIIVHHDCDGSDARHCGSVAHSLPDQILLIGIRAVKLEGGRLAALDFRLLLSLKLLFSDGTE
jgi:hypothetical protein